MAQKHGGPAFPTTPENIPRMNGYASEGMTLRDWFAGQALANSSICTGKAPVWQLKAWFGSPSGISRERIVSRQANEAADAMLKAREATQ